FKCATEFKIFITITSSQANVGHFKTLFVADCSFSIREGADIISESLLRTVDIGTTSGCKAITAFLISGHESQAVIGFVEEPAFDIQIKFVGIIELCIRVSTFIRPGSGVTGIHPVPIDHIATSATESCPASSPDRYLGH